MRWRIATILVLLGLPVLACVLLGMWAIWRSESLLWVWWLFPICWSLAYLLARAGAVPWSCAH